MIPAPMTVRFEKWQALGNDYLIVEAGELPWPLTAARVRSLCDLHTGIGADGVLLLSASPDERYVARLQIFNPDGSEAELSGNGAREAVMYLRRHGWTEADEFEIETAAGPIRPRITGETTCTVDMGPARTQSDGYPGGEPDGRGELEAGGRQWSFQHVAIGNPQCSIRIDSQDQLERLDLPTIGPEIERHALFPKRTNVSWYSELEPGLIRARIFERGVGETLSSGTGASGAAVAYNLAGGPGDVRVLLDGGELEVQIDRDLRVNLTGWAVPVYRGELSDEFSKELDETQ
jgi:diaminopimelate epimerase